MRDPTKVIAFGEHELDFGRGELRHREKPVDIQPTPLRLLLYLAEHRDRTVPRRELLDALWPGVVVGDEALTTALAEVRRAVGDDGDAQRVIRTQKGAGYRFVAEAEVVAAPASAGRLAVEGSPQPRRLVPLAGVAVAVAVVALVLGAWFFRATPNSRVAEDERQAASAHAAPLTAIAVLPFDDLSPGGDHQWLANGMAEDLIEMLSRSQELQVVARTSARVAKQKAGDIPAIGALLNVGSVVEGSVRRAGEQLRVTVQLIRVKDGYHVWSGRYDRRFDDVLAIQEEIGREIAEALRAELGVAGDTFSWFRTARYTTRDVRAYELVKKGIDRLGRTSFQDEAPIRGLIHYCLEALDVDRDYAQAHASLGWGYYWLWIHRFDPREETREQAIAAARRAIDLEPTNGSAISLLAELSMGIGDWESAKDGVESALVATPGDGILHQWYAMSLTSIGSLEQAAAEAQRAADLDPLTAFPHFVLGNVLLAQRDYEAAAAAFERGAQLGDRPALQTLPFVHHLNGRDSRGLEAWIRLSALEISTGEMEKTLRAAYARGGLESATRAYFEALVSRDGRPCCYGHPCERRAHARPDRRFGSDVRLPRPIHRGALRRLARQGAPDLRPLSRRPAFPGASAAHRSLEPRRRGPGGASPRTAVADSRRFAARLRPQRESIGRRGPSCSYRFASTSASSARVRAHCCSPRMQPPSSRARAPPASGELIEEIIITAERRAIDAQELGVSVSAFTEESLEARNIQEIHDLQFQIPSFVATSGFSQITVRGVGTDINAPSSDPGFGTHVDGVYLTPGAALLDYFDIERIEVLPGPQGSLGGRHTTGGSIYIWTNRPVPEWQFSGEAEVASYQKFRARTVVNGPLGETLAARIAAIYESPAYPLLAKPIGQRAAMNDLDGGTSLRASLRFTPTETLVVDLIGWRTYNSSQGGAWRYLGDYPAYPVGQSPLFFNSTPDYTNATPNPSGALDIRQDRRTRDQTNRAWALQLSAEWELGPVVAKATSHYLDGHFSTDFDSDSSDLDIERSWFDIWLDTFTQELTLASNTDGRFQWLVGGMWQSERPAKWKALLRDSQRNAAAANYTILDVFTFAPATQCGPVGTDSCVFSALPAGFLTYDVDATVRTDVAGAFAHAWIDLTERVRLAGGVRYNRTERDLRDVSLVNVFNESLDIIDDNFCAAVIGSSLPAAACFDALLGAPTGGSLTPGNTAFLVPVRGDRDLFSGNTAPVSLDKTWESVTGNARIELTPREDVLVYASFATGSRAGGFNLVEGWAGHGGFAPETNRAYELGVKSTLREQLRLNAAVYWYDYQNKFTVGLVRGFDLTTNSAEAEIMGAELQLEWAASEALRLRGSVGWLSAEYASGFLARDGSLGPDNPTGFDPAAETGRQHGVSRASEDIDGNPLSRSPEWTLSLGGDYRIELGERGALTARLDFAWRDEINYRQFDNPLDRQRAFTRTDLSLRWEQGEDGAWAELYVNNLEDRREVRTSLANEAIHRQWYLAAPRMLGLRAGWTWRSEQAPFAATRQPVVATR